MHRVGGKRLLKVCMPHCRTSQTRHRPVEFMCPRCVRRQQLWSVHLAVYHFGLARVALSTILASLASRCPPFWPRSRRAVHHFGLARVALSTILASRASRCPPFWPRSRRAVHHFGLARVTLSTILASRASRCPPFWPRARDAVHHFGLARVTLSTILTSRASRCPPFWPRARRITAPLGRVFDCSATRHSGEYLIVQHGSEARNVSQTSWMVYSFNASCEHLL